jgi:hypothetical protein
MRALRGRVPRGCAGADPKLTRAGSDAKGTLLRFGQLFGPRTYSESRQPAPPRIHVDSAARRAYAALGSPPGIVTLVDE